MPKPKLAKSLPRRKTDYELTSKECRRKTLQSDIGDVVWIGCPDSTNPSLIIEALVTTSAAIWLYVTLFYAYHHWPSIKQPLDCKADTHILRRSVNGLQ